MNEVALSEIEQNILRLPADEQLLLISRIAEKLRKKVETHSEFENQLAEMANDKEIQKELREIESDFRRTEFDGLAE